MTNPNPTDQDVERYLSKTGIGVYIQDALTLLLENRPEHPIRFLAEYFQATVKPASPFSRACRYIKATPRNRTAFMNNLVSAFVILDTYKNGTKPCGLTYKDLTKLLELLANDFPIDILSSVVQRMRRRDLDLVDFEVFRLYVLVVLMFEELFEKLEWVFKGYDPDSNGCITVSAFHEILDIMKRDGVFYQQNMNIGQVIFPDESTKKTLSYKEFLTIILERISDFPSASEETSAT